MRKSVRGRGTARAARPGVRQSAGEVQARETANSRPGSGKGGVPSGRRVRRGCWQRPPQTWESGDGGWVGRTPSGGGLQARSATGGEIRGPGTGGRDRHNGTPDPQTKARERAYAARERARDVISTSRPGCLGACPHLGELPLPLRRGQLAHFVPCSPCVSPRPGKSGSFFTDGPGKPPGCFLRP